jgi:hypothetical protein
MPPQPQPNGEAEMVDWWIVGQGQQQQNNHSNRSESFLYAGAGPGGAKNDNGAEGSSAKAAVGGKRSAIGGNGYVGGGGVNGMTVYDPDRRRGGQVEEGHGGRRMGIMGLLCCRA